MKLEICANSFASAKIAMRGGADRIELCQNLESGGTTPSAADIQLTARLKDEFNCKVYVLIRPRSGDFCYSKEEFRVMKNDILFCKHHGIDGIVLGALNHQHEIDADGIVSLLEAAAGMGLTFHRAFDLVRDTKKSIDQIISFGFERILTSGQEATAFKGKEAIQSFVNYAKGRISIMPGAGINLDNAAEIINYTGVDEIHFSAREVIRSEQDSSPLFEMNYWQTNENKVRAMKLLLERLGG